MNRKTFIEWCDYTFNPWRGCTKVSPGCTNCYAETLVTTRLQGEWGKGKPRQVAGAKTLDNPRLWNRKPWICDVCKEPFNSAQQPGTHYANCWHDNKASYHRARVFLGSLMDIFDTESPIGWFASALQTVHDCPELDFLMVTKRPELWLVRAQDALTCPMSEACYNWLHTWVFDLVAPKNVWIITSTENQEMLERRAPEALKIPAAVHGLSCEPLLGPLKFADEHLCQDEKCGHASLDWVIAGGESGVHARPCHLEWLKGIQDQCQAAGVSYFLKQVGSNPWETKFQKWEIHDRKGGIVNDWPLEMRVRQWPEARR